MWATVVATATGAAAGRSPRAAGEPRVVAPLADPGVVPGVGRCTSDGVCTVTDAGGTRPGTRHFLAP